MYTIAKKVNPENFEQRKKDNETFYFGEPKFNFLKDHMGLRPGKVHMFLGPTGGGKSSLARTIISDMCDKYRVTLVATEEAVEDLETTMSYSNKTISHENFSIVEESAILGLLTNRQSVDEYMLQLEWELEINKTEVLIFDNFTTSEIYCDIKLALDFFSKIKILIAKLNIPMIAVCHTKTTVKNGMFFEASDIRGYGGAAIKSEYLYCLFRFSEECDGYVRYANFVFVDKSRTHNNIKEAYRIYYDTQTKEYTSDQKATIQEFKEFIDKSRRKKSG